MQGLGQQNFGVDNSVSNRVVLLLSSECELSEGGLVSGRVFNVDEVLVVRDAVILWQLEEANQSLKQGSPAKQSRPSTQTAKDTDCFQNGNQPTMHSNVAPYKRITHIQAIETATTDGSLFMLLAANHFLTIAWCTLCPSWLDIRSALL